MALVPKAANFLKRGAHSINAQNLMKLKPNEARVASELLAEASERYSFDGCTQIELENTNENWELCRKAFVHALSEDEAEENYKRPPTDEKICSFNWLLMKYLAFLLSESHG